MSDETFGGYAVLAEYPDLAGARRDTPLIWRILWRGFWSSVAGGVLGVAMGVAFTVAGVEVFGGDNMALQVASWAMFAHVAGALCGAYAAISSGDAWESTFLSADIDGRVIVGIRSDEGDVERIARILREKDAVMVFGQTPLPRP